MIDIKVLIVSTEDIQSQWQACFSQTYPVFYNKLPRTHESDKIFFEKNWNGDPGTTFEEHKKENYSEWIDKRENLLT